MRERCSCKVVSRHMKVIGKLLFKTASKSNYNIKTKLKKESGFYFFSMFIGFVFYDISFKVSVCVGVCLWR